MPTPTYSLPAPIIESIVRTALAEDLGPSGQDITSALTIPAGQDITAHITARTDGILAGITAGLSAFTITDPELDITLNYFDGDALNPGDTIATITGNARSIMTAERTALNLIGHLSGIASLTHRYVETIKGTGATICDTRKTLPGLRALQKYAVTCGGGSNHRFGLYDAIMIKDNHIAAAKGITQALTQAAMLKSHMTTLEIEIDTLDQLTEALQNGAHIDCILLDNMPPNTLRQAVEAIKNSPHTHITTEASGNVSLNSVRAIAETGIAMISVGALTHSAPTLDMGLDIQ